MVDRLVAVVGHQIALADIGDIARIAVFGEQMVKRLVLGRAQILRDRVVPFVGIGEDGVDVENDAAEIEHAVTHDIADREIRVRDRRKRRVGVGVRKQRSEEHTSELQSLMRSSYAVFCLKKKNTNIKEDAKI